MESIKGPVKVGKGYIPGVSDRDNTDKNNSDRPGAAGTGENPKTNVEG